MSRFSCDISAFCVCLTHGARLHHTKTLRINQLIKALWHQSLSRLQSRWTEISYIYQEQKKKTVLSALQLLEITYIEIIPKRQKKKANTNLPLYIVKITPYFALEAAEGINPNYHHSHRLQRLFSLKYPYLDFE